MTGRDSARLRLSRGWQHVSCLHHQLCTSDPSGWVSSPTRRNPAEADIQRSSPREASGLRNGDVLFHLSYLHVMFLQLVIALGLPAGGLASASMVGCTPRWHEIRQAPHRSSDITVPTMLVFLFRTLPMQTFRNGQLASGNHDRCSSLPNPVLALGCLATPSRVGQLIAASQRHHF